MAARANEWLIIAKENAAAGEQLRLRERNRASASRYYYAAYQAAHALLFTTPLKGAVPTRGNWDHGPLINAIKDGAIKHLGLDASQAEQLGRRLAAARDARVFADYGPDVQFEDQSLVDTQKAATQFIALAHRHGASQQ